MKKIKEVIRHLADLSGLKRQHFAELKNVDIEGYQTEIDIEVKRLLKSFQNYHPSSTSSQASATNLHRIQTMTEPGLQSLLGSINQPLMLGGGVPSNNNLNPMAFSARSN